MKKIPLFVLFAALIAICLTGCGSEQKISEKFPETKDGAKALLEEFMKPGADNKKLTMELRPTKEDYRAFYIDDSTADRAETHFDKLWSGGNAEVAPKEGQTELILFSATTEELRDLTGEAAEFPGGLLNLATNDNLKPKLTIYVFKFVKPGDRTGMAFEGLTFVNGHWRLFPKPWQFMEAN